MERKRANYAGRKTGGARQCSRSKTARKRRTKWLKQLIQQGREEGSTAAGMIISLEEKFGCPLLQQEPRYLWELPFEKSPTMRLLRLIVYLVEKTVFYVFEPFFQQQVSWTYDRALLLLSKSSAPDHDEAVALGELLYRAGDEKIIEPLSEVWTAVEAGWEEADELDAEARAARRNAFDSSQGFVSPELVELWKRVGSPHLGAAYFCSAGDNLSVRARSVGLSLGQCAVDDDPDLEDDQRIVSSDVRLRAAWEKPYLRATLGEKKRVAAVLRMGTPPCTEFANRRLSGMGFANNIKHFLKLKITPRHVREKYSDVEAWRKDPDKMAAFLADLDRHTGKTLAAVPNLVMQLVLNGAAPGERSVFDIPTVDVVELSQSMSQHPDIEVPEHCAVTKVGTARLFAHRRTLLPVLRYLRPEDTKVKSKLEPSQTRRIIPDKVDAQTIEVAIYDALINIVLAETISTALIRNHFSGYEALRKYVHEPAVYIRAYAQSLAAMFKKG